MYDEIRKQMTLALLSAKFAIQACPDCSIPGHLDLPCEECPLYISGVGCLDAILTTAAINAKKEYL